MAKDTLAVGVRRSLMPLQTLTDERAIRHRLAAFARTLDQRQWDCLGEVFAPEALLIYGAHQPQGLVAIEQHFRAFLGGCGPSQHLLGNIEIEVQGDQAHSVAAVCASHRAVNKDDTREFIARGNYAAQWIRLPQGWRVARWEWQNGWFTGDFSILAPG
jgi:SnoaL-like domain